MFTQFLYRYFIAMNSTFPANVNESDCRYCSVVSKANGEDPIGSASPVDEWLLVEVPHPWNKQLWADKPDYQPLLQQVEKLTSQPERYLKTRLLAIAPDKAESKPDGIQIFYYVRPARSFTQYVKQAYCIPLAQSASLIAALLYDSHNLDPFLPYQQSTAHIRELLICTHTHHDIACGRFGAPLYSLLRRQYVPASQGTLRLWQTNHFGGHRFAPTLIDFPTGQMWGHLEPDMLDALINRQGAVAALRSYYRGWCGLGKFEQIVEREIWQQEGWNWLDVAKTGRLIDWDEKNAGRFLARRLLQWLPSQRVQRLLKAWQQEASWAQVELEFTHPNGTSGAYTAMVKENGTVTTRSNSGESVPFKEQPQYQVTSLYKQSGSH